MLAWERRLKDLWLLLERCHATYMEPDLFRLSTNQFLQTARTVTFIIQKNKASIPDFDAWYQPIAASWSQDKVMAWAKDSRNAIEKEGDLALHSTLAMTLFWSYLAEHDVQLSTGRAELLQAGTKRLIRFARKNLPSGVIDSSAVRIERKWVANTLPEWELLQAFTYIYSTLHRMCKDLSLRIDSPLDGSIPHPTTLFPLREEALKVAYLKLSDLHMHYQRNERVKFDPNALSEERKALAGPYQAAMAASQDFDGVFEALCGMAASTFEEDGYHVPMMFFYGEDLAVVDMLSMHFGDRVDKYIFWRHAADRMVATRARFVVAIGEAWIRDMSRHDYSESLDKLPIIGEQLFVTAVDAEGNFKTASWNVVRQDDDAKPTLARASPGSDWGEDNVPFYFAPIFRALKIPYPKNIASELGPATTTGRKHQLRRPRLPTKPQEDEKP